MIWLLILALLLGFGALWTLTRDHVEVALRLQRVYPLGYGHWTVGMGFLAAAEIVLIVAVLVVAFG